MIPVLFNKEETTFTSLGLGEIDATVVEVERERNGIYTLYMELPFSSDYVALIEQEMQIKADAGARTKWQTFKINRVIKDTDKKIVKVYADHISMDTINDAMKPRVAIRQQTAEGALRQWNANRVSAKRYDVSSDITTVSGTTWTIDKVENARQALGGVEGSILDVWGGEFEFDNNRIILHKEMGREAPTVLEYGRNIVSLEYEELIDGVYTSIYPYATYTPKSEGKRQQEPVMVTLDELIVDGDYAGNYENKRIQIVDFSSKFDSSGENPEIPTQTKLRSLAESYVKTNEVGAPKITQEVDFIDLSRTLDYQDMQVMEEIELNDRVPIFYPNIQITSGAKVIKTVWQPLINQYKNITVATIGALKSSSLNSNLKTSIKELEKQQKQINDTVPYLINAQGNRIWYTTPDDTLEHKIDDTWFKQNGKYTIMYRWNGSMWEEIINNETFSKELEAQFAEIEELLEKYSQDLIALTLRNEEELAEFDKQLEELRKSGVSEEQIDEAIKRAGFDKTEIENLRRQLGETSDTAELAVEMIGNDGKTRYSRNRVDGATDGQVEFGGQPLEVTHNGDGFVAGQTYTISFDALCEMLAKVGYTIDFDYPSEVVREVTVKLTPDAEVLDTIERTVTDSFEDELFEGQNYTVVISSDFYKTVTFRVQTAEDLIERLDLAFKEIVAGNLTSDRILNWNDNPELIIKGVM